MSVYRAWGWILLASLTVALMPLGYIAAFSNSAFVMIYALAFAIGISAVTFGQSRLTRLGWAVGLSLALVIAATLIEALVNPGEEGGAILALIVFGFYVGLPTVIFAVLISLLPSRKARA